MLVVPEPVPPWFCSSLKLLRTWRSSPLSLPLQQGLSVQLHHSQSLFQHFFSSLFFLIFSLVGSASLDLCRLPLDGLVPRLLYLSSAILLAPPLETPPYRPLHPRFFSVAACRPCLSESDFDIPGALASAVGHWIEESVDCGCSDDRGVGYSPGTEERKKKEKEKRKLGILLKSRHQV